MPYGFETVIDRTNSHSTKWSKFDTDVLPMWVADMDFAAPEFLLDVLRQRLAHPILGYSNRPDSLNNAFMDWLEHHFQWTIEPEWIVWVPGVVPALNLACRTLGLTYQRQQPEIMVPTPVYHPFLDLAGNAGVSELLVPQNNHQGHWQMDFEGMQARVSPNTKMLFICNPQNPTGRCYTREELATLTNFIERNDMYLCSDEIHCNIVLNPDARHLPIAAEFPDIAARTISLFAASKVYNVPGVSCAAAVIPDPALRQRFVDARVGLVHGIGPLGFAVAEAAFNDRSDYISELTTYLTQNFALIRDTLGARVDHLDGTYLAWIDVSDLGLNDTEAHFATHGLGLSPGAQFGEPGHVRLNFGCPRSTLQTALERFTRALRI